MTVRTNQTTGLTNGWLANWALEVELSPLWRPDVPALLLNQPSRDTLRQGNIIKYHYHWSMSVCIFVWFSTQVRIIILYAKLSKNSFWLRTMLLALPWCFSPFCYSVIYQHTKNKPQIGGKLKRTLHPLKRTAICYIAFCKYLFFCSFRLNSISKLLYCMLYK